jgi:hypothetical protein
VDLLGGDQREAGLQVEAQLLGKQRQLKPDAGAELSGRTTAGTA